MHLYFGFNSIYVQYTSGLNLSHLFVTISYRIFIGSNLSMLFMTIIFTFFVVILCIFLCVLYLQHKYIFLKISGFEKYHKLFLWSTYWLSYLCLTFDNFLCGYKSSSNWSHGRAFELICYQNNSHQMLASVSYTRLHKCNHPINKALQWLA